MRKLLVEDAVLGAVTHATATSYMRKDFTRPHYWWDSVEHGGGTLGAVGSHKIDALSWLTGTLVSHVSAKLTTPIPSRKKSVESDERMEIIYDLVFISGRSSCHERILREYISYVWQRCDRPHQLDDGP